MTTLFRTLMAAAALANMAASALSQPLEFIRGMAYMAGSPGKMAAMASGAGTEFFPDSGQMYVVSGTLVPTDNFYRP